MAADDHRPLSEFAVARHHAFELDGAAVIFGERVAQIAVKEGVVTVLDRHHGGVDVKGERVLDIVVFQLLTHVVNDLRAATDAPHQFMQFGAVGVPDPIVHHGVGVLQFVHHQRAHVGVVGKDRGSVREKEFLKHVPVARERVVERAELPHAVVFHHHAVGEVGFGEVGEKARGEVGFVFHRDLPHVFAVKAGGVVFLNSLFAHEQQDLASVVEVPVFQRFLDHFGLARFQKTRKEIDGDLFACHLTSTPRRRGRRAPRGRDRSRSRTGGR